MISLLNDKNFTNRNMDRNYLRIISTFAFIVLMLSINTVGAQEARNDKKYGLRLFSSPSGAEVTLNGEWYGTTPLYLKLKEGDYRVLLEREYFEPKEKKFSLGEPTTKEIQLGLKKDISRQFPLLLSISHYRMLEEPPVPELLESSNLGEKLVHYFGDRGFSVLNSGESSELLNSEEIKQVIEEGDMDPARRLAEEYPRAKFLILGESFNTSQENPNPHFDGFTVRGRVELWMVDLTDFTFATSKGTRMSVVSREEWSLESLVRSGRQAIDYFIEWLAGEYIAKRVVEDK